VTSKKKSGSSTEPQQQKTGAMRPSDFPSFVYRQDGSELSYSTAGIIPPVIKLVKKKILPQEWSCGSI
jgi:hypothetical protein